MGLWCVRGERSRWDAFVTSVWCSGLLDKPQDGQVDRQTDSKQGWGGGGGRCVRCYDCCAAFFFSIILSRVAFGWVGVGVGLGRVWFLCRVWCTFVGDMFVFSGSSMDLVGWLMLGVFRSGRRA